MNAPSRRVATTFALVVALSSLPVLVGCRADPAPPARPAPPASSDPAPDTTPAAPPAQPDDPAGLAWLDTELTDVVTGETFRISDFAGRPVLIKSFAVW